MTRPQVAGASPRRVRGKILGLAEQQWVQLLFGAAVVSFLSTLSIGEFTVLAGLGIMLTVVVFGHLCMTANKYVAFPGLIGFSACIQWIVAPIVSTRFVPSFEQYVMSIPINDYLAFAVPATAALWLGLHVPVARVLQERAEITIGGILSKRARRFLDAIIVVGLVLATFPDVVPPSVGFFFYILASFRFLGVLIWMLTRTPGWKLRVGIVLLHLMSEAATEGIFYQLVLWVGYFVLIVAFQKRWRWALGVILLVALVGTGLLQTMKQEYRSAIVTGEVTGKVDRMAELGSLIWGRVVGDEGADTGVTFGDVLVRFNQGWIISRVMDRVPRIVPYANGTTLRDALIYSIVPRVLATDKPAGASQTLFAQYTGIQLPPWTSMGLSIIGELYANFGYYGAITSTFIYGLLIGILYGRFATLARRNAYWWAALPVVLLAAVEPSWNMEDIFNSIVKAGIVLAAAIMLVPALRRLFGFGPLRRRSRRFCGLAGASPRAKGPSAPQW